MVRHAIKQVDDPVWIQIERRHLLPEPLGALLVGPQELGLHQLAGEQEDQLALLQGRKAEARRLSLPPAAPPPGSRTGTGRLG